MSTPLVSSDPSAILNAARCFNQCVPEGYYLSMRTHLLNKVVVTASPPCNSPATPTNVQLGAFTVQDTKLSLSWNYPKNSGSLVTSFTYKVGTVSGGPYTIIKSVGAGKRVVTVDQLTPGTTYFAVVTANSPAGCSSATSAEASATTSGGVSNGLLAGTVGYWKLDDNSTGNGFVWVDSTGNGWGATQHGVFAGSNPAGILNGCLGDPSAGSGSGLTASAAIDARAATAPFSVSCWFQDFGAAFGDNIMSVDDVANQRGWGVYASDSTGGNTGHNFASLQTWDAVGTLSHITTPTSLPCCGAGVGWNHLVWGYDGANTFIVRNNGAKVTLATNGVRRGVAPLGFLTRGDFLANWPGNLDEVAYFNFALSATQITLLFNGGAPLPFSSYS